MVVYANRAGPAMRVTKVSSIIRYAAEAKGAWRTIEVSAEAAINPEENWQTVQQELYRQLGDQLKSMWSRGASKAQTEADSWIELGGNHKEALTPVPSREHFCTAHQIEYKRFTKDGRTWYSHKAPDGKWCKEP
jgi:hypothetical protein